MALSGSNKKIFIACALLGVVILALVWLSFFWEIKIIKNVSENYQKEKLNSLVIQEKKNSFAKLNKEISNLKENTDELSSMFIKKDQALPLLKSLEDAASQSSCEITITPADLSKIKFATSVTQKSSASANPDDTTVQKDQPATGSSKTQKKPDELAALKNYPAFSVQVTGPYPSAVNFVSKMENLSYFIRPLMIDIVPAEKNNQMKPGSETLPAGTNTDQNQRTGQLGENRNVIMKLIVVIYGS
jgi:hypothetical protein